MISFKQTFSVVSQIGPVLCGCVCVGGGGGGIYSVHNSESHLVEAFQGLLDFGQGRVGDANFDLLVLSLSTQPIPHHSAGIAGKSQTHILVKNNWEAQSTKDGLSNTNVFLEESDQHKSPHSREKVSRWVVLTAIELNSRQLLGGGGWGGGGLALQYGSIFAACDESYVFWPILCVFVLSEDPDLTALHCSGGHVI